LGNVREDRGRHDDAEEKLIVDLGTIMGFFE